VAALRAPALTQDSENYTLFSDEERDELLLRLFQHCVVTPPPRPARAATIARSSGCDAGLMAAQD
jgi:hypothetical protein